MAKDQETEEGRGEEEEITAVEEVETIITTEEPTQDKEMEPQAGDKGEVRGDPNIIKLIELMNSMKEEVKQTMNDKFDKNEESLKQMKEETKEQNSRSEHVQAITVDFLADGWTTQDLSLIHI